MGSFVFGLGLDRACKFSRYPMRTSAPANIGPYSQIISVSVIDLEEATSWIVRQRLKPTSMV